MMKIQHNEFPSGFKRIAAGAALILMISGSVAADTPINPDELLKGFVHRPVNFAPGKESDSEARKFQGIPTIARAPGGRLWAVWYAGPEGEDQYNYLVAATSADDGKTWSDIKFVVDPDGDGPKRVADPCLWLDSSGKLWLFWWLNKDGLNLTMAVTTENPDAENPVWTEPRPLFPGVMMNKPVITSSGEWLMPSAVWHQNDSSMVMVTKDRGKIWAMRGAVNIPPARRNCDEHMIVEKKDGSFWMLIRTKDFGISESVSADNGQTWAEAADYQLHATSRFFIGRLNSGNLLFIRHGKINERGSRRDLTAYISGDDGATWKGGLLLDERLGVSYPDAVQASDGTIYAIYDWARYDDKHILMTTFTEEDVLAGAYISKAARSKVLINKADGINPKPRMKKPEPADLKADSKSVPLIPGPSAKMEPQSGTVSEFKGGEKIFTDRDYVLPEPPEAFAGKKFVCSSINSAKAVCVEPGMVYVFTPTKARNKDSVEDTLFAQGFKKTSEKEFILFKREQPSLAEACSVYQKEVKKGGIVEFGKWGVIVF